MTSEFGPEFDAATRDFTLDIPFEQAALLDVFVLVSEARAEAESREDDFKLLDKLWKKVEVVKEGEPNTVKLNSLDVDTIGRLILSAKQMTPTQDGNGVIFLSTEVELAMPKIYGLLSSACLQQGGKVDELLQKRISEL